MAKTKPNIDAHTKKSVTTNVMFKKVGPEALRQRSRYMKKTTKVSESNNEYKPRHVAIPENTLAAEFAGKVRLIRYDYPTLTQSATDSIKLSRETIEERAIAALDATYLALSQRLVGSHNFFNQREQDTTKFNEAIASPLNEQELEWTSTDGKQSGKTMLGVRMKKFQKTIEVEAKEFERHFDEWTGVQAELRHLASLIVGPDGLDSLLAGNFDPESFNDPEQGEMMEEIKAEQKVFMEQIEKAGMEAMEAMTESEKASSSRLIPQSFHMLITFFFARSWSSSRKRTRSPFWPF